MVPSIVFVLVAAASAPPADRMARADYAPNQILIEFREPVAFAVERQLDLKSSGHKLNLSRGLDELNVRYRLKEIKPIFKDFEKHRRRLAGLLKKETRLLTKEEKHILRRLKRAPKHAEVPDLGRIYKIELDLPSGESLEEVVEAYNNDPDVEYAELNYIVSADLTPDDPLYPIQWPLNNTGQMYPESGNYNHPPGTPDCDIDAREAWDIETGSSDVIVAVVDTGVDYTHRDLQGNMWADANACCGYDFINDDNDPMDDHGHGTHCSGIIAAKGDNWLDIAGVCWDARIMGLKFLGADGYGLIAHAVEAFYYAVDNGADVVSNSWGGGGYSETAQQAIDYAYSQGVIMVAAAGNDGSSSTYYPACYEHMISVAATNSNDGRASFSNYGDWVDIAAPGVDILSLRAAVTSMGTIYDDYTTVASGTSMACPHVAGACALALSISPDLEVDELEEILEESTDPIASGICQSGRLNVYEAIMHMVIPKGSVRLDRKTYSCSGVATVEVRHLHLKGAGSQDVTVTTDGGDFETLTLTEIDANTGIFEGGIELSVGAIGIEDGALQISHGQVITAMYEDANDGTGSPATATDVADVDCESPVISNVQIGLPGCQPKITFETDEPTTAYVLWGLSCGEANVVQGSYSGLSTSHTTRLSGVSPETDYFFVIEATDTGGNTAVDNNSGQCYAFTTTGPGDIFVPADEPTIQEAIDNSWDGGRVWVADGTYTGTGNRDISFRGKAIAVRSENGPNNCIIDCQASSTSRHRGFNFINGETAASVVDGFTIKNGYGPLQYLTGGRLSSMGGAIFCQDSSPTIANCIIRNNTAYLEPIRITQNNGT